MPARITQAERIATLESTVATLASNVSTLVDALTAAQARTVAPVAQAPAKAKAESPFVAFLHERAASKLPCSLDAHKGKCNRTFSPKSSGRENHIARLG